MKKIFTLFSAALISVSAWANVVFTTEAGTATYGDGQTLVIDAINDEGDIYFEAPVLKNEGTADVKVKLEYTIDALPAGTTVSDCLSGDCVSRTATGNYSTSEVTVKAGATKSTLIEWSNFTSSMEYAKGTCQITFNVIENGTKTATVIVKFVYEDATSLQAARTAQGAEYFSILGQKANASTKGIVLVRTADGSVKKMTVRN